MQISLFVALAALATAPTQPTLEHTAPFLGHTLVIDVDSAPALQTVVLLYSPRAGHTPTPFGLFELERPTSQRVAIGMTDALGQASFSLPIPASASIAENEAHFQALVDDPSAIEGKVFSDAVHVRLLGTRIYTGLKRSEIEIVSPIRDQTIALVRFTQLLWQNGPAVFSGNYSAGAVVAQEPISQISALVRFDPFFGALLGQTGFGPTSPTPLGDLTGQRAFVLELSGRISAVDLTSGAIVGHIDLPNPVNGVWCSNSRRTEAYVAESGPAVRRIHLDTLTDMGSFVVASGDTSQTISSMTFANKTLLVTSEYHQWLPALSYSALTRIDFSQAQPVTTVQPDVGFMLQRAAVGASADRFVMLAEQLVDGWFATPRHHVTSLSAPGPIVDAGHPPFHPGPGMAFNIDMVVRDSDAWSLGKDVDDYDNPVLYRLNLDDLTWSWYPPVTTWGTGPADLAMARDDHVDELYVALWRSYGHPPRIVVIAQPSLTERTITLSRDPLTMHSVSVP